MERESIEERHKRLGIEGPPPEPVSVEEFRRLHPNIDSDDPGDSHIRERVIRFLRDSDEEDFRRMAKKGELDEYLAQAVDAVRSDAEGRIQAGYMESEAWRLAIRTQVYGLQED